MNPSFIFILVLVFIPHFLFSQNEEQSGQIKGTVTWQYNKYVGTRPDVNATIILIPEDLKEGNYYFIIENNSDVVQTIPESEHKIFLAKANGYGNYEINDVPIGEYFVLIISKKTTDDPKKETNLNRLNKVLKQHNIDYLCALVSVHKYYLTNVTIKTNKTTDVSH
ncbi:MAG: hypothetical protein MUE56_02600, partial [Ignavibacteria bacterium]|nr:hypothetical protein [Ignavibacteria bacterium]